MGLGERIKKSRILAGLSQSQLGDKIGTDSNTISRWERDSISPKAETVAKLAAALDTSVGFLLDETGSQTIKNVAKGHSSIAGGSGNIVLDRISGGISGGISGNAVVRLCEECIVKNEHKHVHVGEEELTTENISVPLGKNTVIEYHEGASESESDKKIKLTFPPDTSPEKMEEIIERAARAFLGNVSRENTPKQPVKEKSKNSAG